MSSYPVKGDLLWSNERMHISEFLNNEGADFTQIMAFNNLLSNRNFMTILEDRKLEVLKKDKNYPKDNNEKKIDKLYSSYKLKINYDKETSKIDFIFEDSKGKVSENIGKANLNIKNENSDTNPIDRSDAFGKQARKGLIDNIFLCAGSNKTTLNKYISDHCKGFDNIDDLFKLIQNKLTDVAVFLKKNESSPTEGIADFLCQNFKIYARFAGDKIIEKDQVFALLSRTLMAMIFMNEEGKTDSFDDFVKGASSDIKETDGSNPTDDEVDLMKAACLLMGFDENAGAIFNQFDVGNLSQKELNQLTRAASQDFITDAIKCNLFTRNIDVSNDIHKDVLYALNLFTEKIDNTISNINKSISNQTNNSFEAPEKNMFFKKILANKFADRLPKAIFKDQEMSLVKFSKILVNSSVALDHIDDDSDSYEILEGEPIVKRLSDSSSEAILVKEVSDKGKEEAEDPGLAKNKTID